MHIDSLRYGLGSLTPSLSEQGARPVFLAAVYKFNMGSLTGGTGSLSMPFKHQVPTSHSESVLVSNWAKGSEFTEPARPDLRDHAGAVVLASSSSSVTSLAASNHTAP